MKVAEVLLAIIIAILIIAAMAYSNPKIGAALQTGVIVVAGIAITIAFFKIAGWI